MGNYEIDKFLLTDFLSNSDLIEDIKTLETQRELFVTDRYLNRLDNVAFDCYGSVNLWWVLAIFNDILDPTEFPETLLKIKIPYLDSIASMLEKHRLET